MNDQVHLIEHSTSSRRYSCSDDSRISILGEGFYLFQRISNLTIYQSPGGGNKPCRSSYSFLIQAIHLLPHNSHFWQVSRWCWENCFRDHILRTNDLVQTLNKDFSENYLGTQTSDHVTHLERCLPQNHGVVLTEFCVCWGHMPVTLVSSYLKIKRQEF